jgi:ABC-type branched-subunit amino acid transport system permease subunit
VTTWISAARDRAWLSPTGTILAGVVTIAVISVEGSPWLAALAGAIVGAATAALAGARALGPALVAVVLCAAPFEWSAFNLSQILVLTIGALGLVLLSGQTGQISVAQGPFVGVGAYTVAFLAGMHGVPGLAALPLGVLTGALAGLIVGIPTARLRGIYQVITTLGVGVAFPSIIIVIGNPVGGDTGIAVPSPINFTVRFGDQYLSPTQLSYILCVACALLAWFVLARAARSRHGTAMRALRQNDVVAAVNGIRVGRYRVVAFVLSAAFAGLAGGLYALTVGAVSPESFGLLYSIEFLVAIAIGGSEEPAGAVVGSIAVFLLTTQVNQIPVPGSNVDISNEVVYGVAVILVLLLLRGGIWGGLTRLVALLGPGRGRQQAASVALDQLSAAQPSPGEPEDQDGASLAPPPTGKPESTPSGGHP